MIFTLYYAGLGTTVCDIQTRGKAGLVSGLNYAGPVLLICLCSLIHIVIFTLYNPGFGTTGCDIQTRGKAGLVSGLNYAEPVLLGRKE